MAHYRFSEGTEERELFNEFWKLCQTFWIPEDTDEYWKQLHDACIKFGKMYGRFSEELAIAFLKETERKWKIENKSEKKT